MSFTSRMQDLLAGPGEVSLERPDCVIATSGIDPQEQALLTSMLDLLGGRCRGHWRIGGIASAQVLMFSAAADESELAAWKASGKPWIALTHHDDDPTTASHVLQRPIRVFPLLNLIKEIEEEAGFLGQVATVTIEPRELPPRWRFADQLRTLGLGAGHGEWYSAGPLLVSDDGRQFAASSDVLAQLREGRFEPAPLGARCAHPPVGMPLHPIEELAWWIGWWSDAQQLAPWLDAGMQFRLRHWPDFGLIPVARSTLRLAALSAQKLWTLPQLVDTGVAGRGEVVRFVNAMSVSGLLVTHAAPPRPAPPPKPGLVAGLLRGLRLRLGLT